MAEAAKDQDQSMEDILQSIKRIIAEEGDAPPTAGSDVLELTELLAEDGSVSTVTSDGEKPKVETLSIEEIMAAPISSMPAKPAEPAAEAAPAPVAPPPAVETKPAEAEPVPEASATEEEGLLSNTTLSASVAALNALRDSMAPASPPRSGGIGFRSGLTVEDLVLEGLKPMLKEWLDQNLPSLVETLVKKEISKLTQN